MAIFLSILSISNIIFHNLSTHVCIYLQRNYGCEKWKCLMAPQIKCVCYNLIDTYSLDAPTTLYWFALSQNLYHYKLLQRLPQISTILLLILTWKQNNILHKNEQLTTKHMKSTNKKHKHHLVTNWRAQKQNRLKTETKQHNDAKN